MLNDLISKRTLACVLSSFVLMAYAVYSWFAIPIEVLPKENTPPYLMVRVNSPLVLNTDLLEMTLATSVEGALRTVSNIQSLSSTVDGSGVAVSLNLKPGTDLDISTIQIYEALSPLAELGQIDNSQVTVTRLNPDAIAVVKLSLALKNQNKVDYRRLKEEIKINLESIPGVAKTEVLGMEPSVVDGTFSPLEMKKYSILSTDLSRFLNVKNFQEYVGPLQTGQINMPVFFKMETTDVQQVLKKPFSIQRPISIEAMSDIKIRKKQDDDFVRINGNSTFLIEIFPKDGANLFNMNSGLQRGIEQLEKGSYKGKIQIDTIFNQTDDLKFAISEVFESLYEAMLITCIVVLVFYRNIMLTVLINISIPITLVLTVLFLFLTGKTLNILTLSGLILGIGTVVDNADLLLGRIDELKKNMNIKSAAGKAAVDVSVALILSSITNSLIFAPIVFIDGGDSFIDLLKAFQMPILGSIIASLIVALIILPLIRIFWSMGFEHSKRTVQDNIGSSDKKEDFELFIPFFMKIHKYRLILAIGSICVFLFFLDKVAKMDSADLESPRDPYIVANLQFSREISTEIKRDKFNELEALILSQKEKLKYKMLLSEFSPENTRGALTFYPLESEDKDLELNQLELRLKNFASEINSYPGMNFSVGFSYFQQSSGKTKFPINIEASFQRSMQSITDSLYEHLKSVSGFVDIKMEKDDKATKQFLFVPNYELLNKLSIGTANIANTISSVINEISIDNLKLNGEAIVLRLKIPSEDRGWKLEDILNIDISTSSGSIKVKELGKVELENISRSINRKNQKSIVKLIVTVDSQVRNATEIRNEIMGKIKGFSFPPGIKLETDDSAQRIIEMQKKTNFVILLSVFLIYLVLASIFESLFIPIAIIFSIPLALVFGAGGLWMIGQPLDVMARLGLVILVGVGVNSAIILIDLIVSLREQGYRRREAIYIGCAKRLKTVLMTTTIQVISVIPVALGKAKLMGIPYSSLGIVIISGMLFSTLVTLILLPIIYELCDQVDVFFKKTRQSEKQTQ